MSDGAAAGAQLSSGDRGTPAAAVARRTHFAEPPRHRQEGDHHVRNLTATERDTVQRAENSALRHCHAKRLADWHEERMIHD